ncbi:hypothetical protein C483_13623 [Natrialba hulunbeirensis JCM 10989]|uniref:DUF7575 domain-containing protein n=1 Tax=Natrialba hulunbeirensis JCM 10989 TaxID=1227493 RepID=L9ZT97_9EURY|nr:zinc ribbon domain-containing protein [Natrialba hulunbeirensis]ELY89569.1 hypothetical protein C483_13623 [Natrialba hulunbeirensis JCM 10989]
MTWLRALVAGGISLFLPGAGHALIRDWIRALVFGGLFIGAAVVFLPTGEIAAADSVSDSMTAVANETDTITQFLFSFIALFAAIDATFRGLGFPPGSNTNADGEGGPSCPECGKELDEDLTFCHWCTTRLEPAADAETEAETDANPK